LFLAPIQQRRKKMRQTFHHIDDPTTSAGAVLVFMVLGFLGLFVLMVMLALESNPTNRYETEERL
jgi:hypothetical protein